jgi:hypothetical protein
MMLLDFMKSVKIALVSTLFVGLYALVHILLPPPIDYYTGIPIDIIGEGFVYIGEEFARHRRITLIATIALSISLILALVNMKQVAEYYGRKTRVSMFLKVNVVACGIIWIGIILSKAVG